MEDKSLIINGKTAAALLGVSTVTLWKLRKRGIVKELESFTPPRYSRAHIDELASKIAK